MQRVNDELTAVRQLIKETMEAAIELAVPLTNENAAKLGTSKIKQDTRASKPTEN